MFKKKSPEQQIIVEAEKVSSMKESLDALSWDRVAEIAKEMQGSVSDEERSEYSRELLAIAQANTSLLGKLGLSGNSLSGQFMPSGIEMLQKDVSIESFEPEEPEIFAKPDESSLEEVSSGEAKQAAPSFLYENKPSLDQDLPEEEEEASATQNNVPKQTPVRKKKKKKKKSREIEGYILIDELAVDD